MCGFSTPTNTRFARVTRQEEAIKEFNSAEDTTWKNNNYKEWLRCGAREQKTECANGGFNQIRWYGGERKPLFLFRLHFIDFRVRGAVVLPSHASINRNWMALHWNLVATGEWRSRISGARVWELICTLYCVRPPSSKAMDGGHAVISINTNNIKNLSAESGGAMRFYWSEEWSFLFQGTH